MYVRNNRQPVLSGVFIFKKSNFLLKSGHINRLDIRGYINRGLL